MKDVLEIAGRKLEVRWLPPTLAGKPTLVFLHEGLGSLDLWRSFPADAARATGCGVLIASRYGNGFSQVLVGPRDVRYMHDEATVVLPELLRRCGVRRPLLVGHSDGASIALIYAAGGAPIAGAILEAPHVFVEDLSVASIAAIRVAYQRTDLRMRMAPHHADVDATFYGWNDIWLAPAFASWNIEGLLPSIDAPLLLVQGEDDRYGTLGQIEAIQNGVKSERVERIILANCAHAPHRDRSDDVLAAVARFVRETTQL
jgi:pimeloyl-ACP methyl ester carboxylesterase